MNFCSKCSNAIQDNEFYCEDCLNDQNKMFKNSNEEHSTFQIYKSSNTFNKNIRIILSLVFCCWCVSYVSAFIYLFSSDYYTLIGESGFSEKEWLQLNPDLMSRSQDLDTDNIPEDVNQDMKNIIALVIMIGEFSSQLSEPPTNIKVTWWSMWTTEWETPPITIENLTPSQEAILDNSILGAMLKDFETMSDTKKLTFAGQSQWARTAPLVLYKGTNNNGNSPIYTTSSHWSAIGIPSSPDQTVSGFFQKSLAEYASSFLQ